MEFYKEKDLKIKNTIRKDKIVIGNLILNKEDYIAIETNENFIIVGIFKKKTKEEIKEEIKNYNIGDKIAIKCDIKIKDGSLILPVIIKNITFIEKKEK